MANPAACLRLGPAAVLLMAVLAIAVRISPAAADGDEPAAGVAIEIFEGIPDKRSWDFELGVAAERYDLPALGLVCTPKKYTGQGLPGERSNPFVVSGVVRVALPAGETRLILRSKNAARLLMDGAVVAETKFLNPNASGHEHVPEAAAPSDARLALLAPGHQEQDVSLSLDGLPHEFRLLAFVGGSKLRPEIGEVCVAVAQGNDLPRLLGPVATIPLSEEGWRDYAAHCDERQQVRDHAARRAAGANAAKYWAFRHELARRELHARPERPLPATVRPAAEYNEIDRFINARLDAAGRAPAPLAADLAFLRRLALDTVGVIPTRHEIDVYLADEAASRRRRAIDRLLDDPRWADNWVGYWQDVLAENPGILKPTLNNTGPFRWWIYESFFDNKPMDQFVTELVEMGGGRWTGGPAGFALATQNDAPMAAKAHIIGKAFLAIDMQCARCHDAPFHPFRQKDLFSVAAMLANEPQKVPPTSTVILAERTRRPLIEVTLEPGVPIAPEWPFADIATAELPAGILPAPAESRAALAAILTSPRNDRFPRVIVNRLWQRYLGAALVEPVDDWRDARPSHPELLDYLAREFVLHDYDLKHVARLIFQSHTYQREIIGAAAPQAEAERLFAAPYRRRLSAEQLVDSLFQAAGKEFHCEELTMDPEGRRPVTEMLNLGRPKRAWQLTSLSNERDRPALSLPAAQGIVDLLTSFGWRESRQNPLTVREESPTPGPPMILANGVVGNRIARLSDDSALTGLALEDRPLNELVEAIFRQVLSRSPTADELKIFGDLLAEGYGSRRTAGETSALSAGRPRSSSAVSWSNHLSPEATRMKLELERAAREGDPPTARLNSDWRERMEDMVWALVNAPEFVFIP